jgi:hypothetical protein
VSLVKDLQMVLSASFLRPKSLDSTVLESMGEPCPSLWGVVAQFG